MNKKPLNILSERRFLNPPKVSMLDLINEKKEPSIPVSKLEELIKDKYLPDNESFEAVRADLLQKLIDEAKK